MANEITLSKAEIDILRFALLGVKPKYAQHAFLLYNIYQPKGAGYSRDFDLSNLVITIPSIDEKIYGDEIRTSGDTMQYKCASGCLLEADLAGTFILNRYDIEKLREAKEKGDKIFVYYKGGGPRVELKLPGEI